MKRRAINLSPSHLRQAGVAPGVYVVQGKSEHDGLLDKGIFIEWQHAETGRSMRFQLGLYADGCGLRPGDEVEVRRKVYICQVSPAALREKKLQADQEYEVQVDLLSMRAEPHSGPYVSNGHGEKVHLWDLRSASSAFTHEKTAGDVIVFASF